MRDACSNMLIKRAISSISGAGDNTAQVSQIIDVQGYDSLTFVLNTGVLADADATFVTLVEESDASDLSGSNAVSDGDLISQDTTSASTPEVLSSFQFDDDSEVRKIGYRGTKRYVRLTITPASNTGAWPIGVIAVLTRAEFKPITQSMS